MLSPFSSLSATLLPSNLLVCCFGLFFTIKGGIRCRLGGRLGRPVGPTEFFEAMHTRGQDRETFVDQHSADLAARTQQILSQRTQSGSKPSYQDKCEAYLKAVGECGPGGSVFGVGSAAPHFFSEQIQTPRRDATQSSQMSRENAALRTEVQKLRQIVQEQRQEFDSIRQQMEEFMASVYANQTAPSSSHQAPPALDQPALNQPLGDQ